IAGMPARLAESICAKRVECCETDGDVCMTEVLGVLAGIYPDLDEAEESETAALDCAAFDACALAIHEASCSDWPFQGGALGGLPADEPACLEIITPTATDGEDCRYNYECIDGLCRVPEGETVGACDEFANLNDSCDDVCNPVTMFCNDANACQERLPNGASCTNHDHCESRVCDIGGSDECIDPGPDHCEFVPNGAAHCTLAGAPGSRQTGFGSLALLIVAGLAASAARRRRAASSDSL
ncbi:MAG TPA: hypothetical protein VFU02_15400, partial [Polyangiaceae bacterium]|nr:hypothetical protein [Polyangiaceae bacterium]